MSRKEHKEIPDLNIFMMCKKLDESALCELSDDFYVRTCRKDEFDIWASFPFDTEEDIKQYRNFMVDYFNTTYANKGDLFYHKCLFVCDKNDKPIATCFVWKSYDEFNAIHWFKTLKGYEGLGIGRALLSIVMKSLKPEDYPIYLHTQPASYRAIKLYSDFGFGILTDPSYGDRTNDIEECLPILEEQIPKEYFKKLKFTKAPQHFKKSVNSSNTRQF